MLAPTIDKFRGLYYNHANFIGQFVTILSVNKTRESDGRIASIFLWYLILRSYWCA